MQGWGSHTTSCTGIRCARGGHASTGHAKTGQGKTVMQRLNMQRWAAMQRSGGCARGRGATAGQLCSHARTGCARDEQWCKGGAAMQRPGMQQLDRCASTVRARVGCARGSSAMHGLCKGQSVMHMLSVQQLGGHVRAAVASTAMTQEHSRFARAEHLLKG